MGHLRTCKGNFGQIFVVAVQNNGTGRQYVCHVEAEAFWERVLQNRETRDGPYGPFWILSRGDIDGDDGGNNPFSTLPL